MSTPGRSPRDGARRKVRRLISDAAAGIFAREVAAGPDAASGERAEPVVDHEPGPLARVAAARFVSAVAAAAMREHALDARAAGCSWDEVASAIELDDPPDGPRRGEVAYEWLVEHRAPEPDSTRLCDRPAASWRCASCWAWVRDTGPFESHPDDREQGHTEGCARHAAELAAWRRGVDELDQDEDGSDQDWDEDEPEGDS